MENTLSDQSTSNKTTPREITVGDIQQFFDEKRVFNGCPCCSQNGWTLIETPKNYVWNFGSNMTDGGFVMPSPSIPVALLACNNCGYIKAHAAAMIWEHLSSKEQASGS